MFCCALYRFSQRRRTLRVTSNKDSGYDFGISEQRLHVRLLEDSTLKRYFCQDCAFMRRCNAAISCSEADAEVALACQTRLKCIYLHLILVLSWQKLFYHQITAAFRRSLSKASIQLSKPYNAGELPWEAAVFVHIFAFPHQGNCRQVTSYLSLRASIANNLVSSWQSLDIIQEVNELWLTKWAHITFVSSTPCLHSVFRMQLIISAVAGSRRIHNRRFEDCNPGHEPCMGDDVLRIGVV